MRKGITVVALALMIQGCAIFDILKPQDDNVTIHPELPRPVQPVNVDWKVDQINDEIVVMTSYDEFLNLLENQNDIVRFIDQMNNTVCYYRKELEETFCQLSHDE